MTRVKIYDSEGYEYGREGAKRNEQIASFFTSSVRAIIDASSTSIKMICYFRAREGKGQRTNQFYAEYGAESLKSVYREFKSSVEKKAKELGLEVDYSRESTHILRDIDKVDAGLPGISDTDMDCVKRLIEKREKLDFGASDYNVAIKAAKEAIYQKRVVAISDSGRVNEIKNVDVVFDTGYNGRGLEPSKETKRKIKDVRRSVRQNQVKESLNNVREELQKLKRLSGKDGVNRSDVNDRLKNIVRNEFPNIFPKRKTTVSQTEQTATRSTQSKSVFDEYQLPVMILGGGIIFLLVAFGFLDIPILGDLIGGIMDSSEVLSNIIEASIFVAVVVAISGAASLAVDNAPGAPAVVVSVVALALIMGTVIPAGMGAIGGLGGSADPGGNDAPAGNGSNNGGSSPAGGSDTGGTDDPVDDGSGNTGNDGDGDNTDGGGNSPSAGGGNGGGLNSVITGGATADEMQNAYEELGSYQVDMTIIEGGEDMEETIYYSADEGCVKYNGTDTTRHFIWQGSSDESIYNVDYYSDGELKDDNQYRGRGFFGILYGEFIPTGDTEVSGNSDWKITEIKPFGDRNEPLPKEVTAESNDGETLTVEYSSLVDKRSISDSICPGTSGTP